MMVDSQLAKTFSEDKQRFFSSIESQKDASLIPLARNHSRYRLALTPLPADRPLEKNKLYLERFSFQRRYNYKFLDGSNRLIQGENTDFADILRQTTQQGHNGFHFVAQHRALIVQEFNTLYAALLKNGREREAFWAHCYSLCFDLENYYLDDAYSNPVEAAKYYELRKKLEYRLEHKRFEEQTKRKHIERSIAQQLSAAIVDLLDTLQHTSAIRAWLGFINLYRILFVFSRLAVKQSLVLATELKWIESLSRLIHMPIDVTALVSMINAPNGLFNLLSVGLFELRLCIILCEIAKHVWFVSTEKEQSRTKTERLKQELYERCLELYNDLAWSIVNTLCNFGYLSDPIAIQLTAVFLLFDAMALMARYLMDRQTYLLKTEQFKLEQQFYLNSTTLTPEQIEQHLSVLREQQLELDIEWGANRAKLWFLTGAALVLMCGFSASFIFLIPATAATFSLLACTVAVAMFLSSGKYQEYKKATLSQELAPGEDLEAAAKAVSDARWAFYTTLTKNTVMPLVMVTAFAVFWPGALVLAVGYIYNESRGSPTPPAVNPNDSSVKALRDDERDADLAQIPMIAC